jgi:hypothetical protein
MIERSGKGYLPKAWPVLSQPDFSRDRFDLYLESAVHAPASVVAPIWSAQPIVSFFSPRPRSKGVEEVTFRDGARALVVVGVLVLRWDDYAFKVQG